MTKEQAERYRQAAEDALGQLDWCIRYLNGIHKQRIAARLAKNCAYIRRELLQDAAGSPRRR